MTTYKNEHEGEVAGKGIGETISEAELAGWDIEHLLKIGALSVLTKNSTPTTSEKEK